MESKEILATNRPNFVALLPLLCFFVLYGLTWLFTGSLSALPISVAFLITSVLAILLSRHDKITVRVGVFCKGAANDTIMLMVLIFVLAGAFAGTAKSMGAVDATVNLTLYLLPENLVVASVFIAACFISMSMGTSSGTIAALAPIAVGISGTTGLGLPLMLGVVIGGAMFGDSLSFISDTTIVATRTQGCNLKDKFKVNVRILFPVTILLLFYYLHIGWEFKGTNSTSINDIEWIKVIPYCVVLISALAGMNVIAVLILGIALSGVIGLLAGSFSVWDWASSMQSGIVSDMGELIIVSLLAGGLFGVIHHNGGIDWLINKLSKNIKNKRQAEFRVAALVCFTDFCTANNTVALIITGPIARKVADQFGIDKRKMASIIDTFSCAVQGILPYGAQLLIASSLSGVNPMQIIPYLYYPFLMALASIVAVFFRLPQKYS
ncbi:Na+/H+ antiporter NhaC family protein [Dysgonomonas sp. 216]|uniref:Na+/H+ antiporter NhaC family protein n=1 Tax=Dysgonomonas sp. 216 TaxID=2302934 RepID=UPI0013D53154|nr:Na+/H+ antiporter NhaC family protein [Dysgonomonas sp. 216]NDW17788.1 Na+/H+ antiporter NhaC family protein [Dysgonomonas sp. 216]